MTIRPDDLLEIGLVPTLDQLRRLLSSAVQRLGFGLFVGALVRGDMRTGRAWIETVSNTPAGFAEAQRSLGDALRDPVTTALAKSVVPVHYDQRTYVEAGCPDLWDMQASFGYRCGVACAMHQASHLETFAFGVDREDVLPAGAGERAWLDAHVRMLMLHAQSAMQRLYTDPVPVPDLTSLELETLKWARDGRSVWQTGDFLSISAIDVARLQRRAVTKLGMPSVQAAVLKCIQGGLIDR